MNLPIVRSGLLSHQLDGQVLVYDTTGDRVHLLDPTTALVLELLRDGERSYSVLCGEVARKLDTQSAGDVVELAISELHEAGLFDESKEKVATLPEMNRRELVRSLAAAGVAAVAIPTIASLTATIAAAQAGQSFRGTGQACGGAAVCAPGLTCCGGICRDGFCNGASCATNAQCFSGNCCATTGNTCEPTCPAAVGSCRACSINAECVSNSCGTGGACAPGTNPNGRPTGFSGSFNPQNCGSNATQTANRQATANGLCCTGSATLGNSGQCDAGNQQPYSCN